MAILAFILIAHEPAEVVEKSVDMLLAADSECLIAVHYDGNSPSADFAGLQRRYAGNARVVLVEDRARCGWGQFGLVDGTIRALRLLAAHGKDYTHAYLVSCACWPIRPLAALRQFLDHNGGVDFVESHDECWITGGLRQERYTLRHPFSFTRQRGLFEASVRLQRRLGIRRTISAGLTPRYGSQWWCLRHKTIAGILRWVDENPAAYRFYRQVWIPDETFFQTVVHALGGAVAPGYIPTLYTFNVHGKPIVFYDDHLEWLQQQPHFFARKIAQSAQQCRAALAALAGLPHSAERAILAVPPAETRMPPRAQAAPSSYGQIFESGSGMRNWPRNLETMRHPSAILYGPPPLTRLAADILGASGGLIVLGRLFHAERIGFQPGQTDFHGLQSRETTLRDYDRALYLSRVLARCKDLPVFELCPGDDPVLEKLVLENERSFIAIPIFPGGRLPAWRFLFWYLALPERQRTAIDAAGDRFDRLRRTEEAAKRHFGQKHVAAVERKLFSPANGAGLVFAGAGSPPDPAWKAALGFLHGGRAEPLLESLDRAAEILAGQDWRTLAPSFAGDAAGLATNHG